LECVTYRNYGHFEGDEQKYKAPSGKEKEEANRDCISQFRDYAIEHQLLTNKEAEEIESQSMADIEHAIKFAEESPVPRPEALF
ncbi:thiamine pyrophosphate-dependent enzyme, partial [Alkalihalophilus lindianensis]